MGALKDPPKVFFNTPNWNTPRATQPLPFQAIFRDSGIPSCSNGKLLKGCAFFRGVARIFLGYPEGVSLRGG